MPAVGCGGHRHADPVGALDGENDAGRRREHDRQQRTALAVGNHEQRLWRVGRSGFRRSKPAVDREATFACHEAGEIGRALRITGAVDGEPTAKPARVIGDRGLPDELRRPVGGPAGRLPSGGRKRAIVIFQKVVEAPLFEQVARGLVAVGGGDELPEEDGAEIRLGGLDPRGRVLRHGLHGRKLEVLRRGAAGAEGGYDKRTNHS